MKTLTMETSTEEHINIFFVTDKKRALSWDIPSCQMLSLRLYLQYCSALSNMFYIVPVCQQSCSIFSPELCSLFSEGNST